MANTRPVTELDFDALKTNLIDFIKANPTYSDYNFEGSALNTLMDILAYNTHNNLYYANMVHNEGFLDTAQKRSSVVSRAKELGYTPRSAVCSTAYVNLVANGVDGSTQPFILSRGTQFSSSNDNGSYTFIVVSDQLSEIIDGAHKFNQVKIVCGEQTQNYFKVDTTSNVRSIYTIPNKNVDVSTLKVFVRESMSSVERTEYFPAENVYGLSADSRSYFLQESYDGSFQIYFGGDIFGKQPVNGNVIDIDYVIATGMSSADLCNSFIYNANLELSLTATTTQVSFGGAEKETLESIKYNAVKSNSAKERSVTTDDYVLSLKEKFSFIKSVSVWGGENNVPPVYGKVFISIEPISGYVLSPTVKRDVIMPAIMQSSMMTITPEILDPSYIAIDFTTNIKFNPHKTMSGVASVESMIKNGIRSYLDSISTFNNDFFMSKLINNLTALDPGIVSVSVDKTIGFKISSVVGTEFMYKKLLSNPIKASTVTSSKFNVFYGKLETVSIKPIIGKTETKTNNLGLSEKYQYLGLYNNSNILVKEIGTVIESTGEFNIVMNIYSYITNNRFINIRCLSVNDDIMVSRNQILLIETHNADAVAGIVNNNIVNTEIYGK